jgi:hypothetical protein
VCVVRLVVCIKFRCNILIIKELPGLVGSGTPCITALCELRELSRNPDAPELQVCVGCFPFGLEEAPVVLIGGVFK